MLFSKKYRIHFIFNLIICAILSGSLISVIALDWREPNKQVEKNSQIASTSGNFDFFNVDDEKKLIPQGINKSSDEVHEKEFLIKSKDALNENQQATLDIKATVEAKDHGFNDPEKIQTLNDLLKNAVKFQHFIVEATNNNETELNANTRAKGEFIVKTKVWLDNKVLGESTNQAAFNLLKQAATNSDFSLSFSHSLKLNNDIWHDQIEHVWDIKLNLVNYNNSLEQETVTSQNPTLSPDDATVTDGRQGSKESQLENTVNTSNNRGGLIFNLGWGLNRFRDGAVAAGRGLINAGKQLLSGQDDKKK
ncbi:hypothetical protein PA0119 [Candidatus Phytoplasma australiense]|uniref:Uncharacterized protein n=1 Tax=Phytoplasma australiense TaxID=59748 RepID=B1V922_PHYAS|nr:hypothetical protein PA0119 [Candidatus Phytoplasma australiense]